MRRIGFRFAVARGELKCALVAASCLVGSWSPSALAQDAIVRPHQLRQHISGFGASSAWTAQKLTDADADLLFSQDKGVGFSLLRVRIVPDGTTWELSTAQQAQARGASVWATPWSPPAEWKTNGNVNYGGKLLPEHADDWAASLASFVVSMQTAGVNLLALSAQNEPTTGSDSGVACDNTVPNCINYEACKYTSQELGDFVAGHLMPALTNAGVSVKVLGPETQGWNDFSNYWSRFNSLTSPDVKIVATHDYNGAPASYPDIAQSGRELWQTETYDRVRAPDPGIASALRVATTMQSALVDGNVSAWLYWWILPGSDDNGGLFVHGTGEPTKRLYGMGNFSRFVRPGYYRVLLDATLVPDFSLSAYVDSNQDGDARKLVLVAVNASASPVTQKLRFDGYTTGGWQAVVTSDALNLEPGPAIPDNAGGDFEYTFDAQTITTLSGVTTGKGPPIARDTTEDSLPPEDGGCACSAAGKPASPAGALALGAAAFFGVFSGLRRLRRRA